MAFRLEQFRDPELEMSGDGIVGFYSREFWPLDQFAAIQIDYLGRRMPTGEHAYHYTKFVDHSDIAEEIVDARSPHDALHLAHANLPYVRPDWDDIKVGVMRTICELKLRQNPYVERKLRQTGDFIIVEDSPDKFWGRGPGPKYDGRNELGNIWMNLRTKLLEVED